MNGKQCVRVLGRGLRSLMVTGAVAGLLLVGPAAPVAVAAGADTGLAPAPTAMLPAEAALPDGIALAPPATGTKRVQAAQSKRGNTLSGTTQASPTSEPLLFATADPTRSDVAEDWRPYHRLAPVTLGNGVRDSDGVRMYKIGSTLYDHPVAQAADGIDSFESWLLTKDQRYLDQALGDAHRLADRRVESREAWYFPYPFDFALHGDKTDVISAPWYSAMAQGQALSLFARLKKQTGDPQWEVALTRTLASLSLGPTSDASVPFVAWVTQTTGSGWRSTPNSPSSGATAPSTGTSSRCSGCGTPSSSPLTQRPSACSGGQPRRCAATSTTGCDGHSGSAATA